MYNTGSILVLPKKSPMDKCTVSDFYLWQISTITSEDKETELCPPHKWTTYPQQQAKT
jgi:hypothetical protein